MVLDLNEFLDPVPDPEKQARKQRMITVIAIIPAITALFYIIYTFLGGRERYHSSEILIIFAMMGISFMVMLMRYLQTGSFFRIKVSTGEPFHPSITTLEAEILEQQIKDQKGQINKIKSSVNELTNKLSNIKSVYQDFTIEQREQLVSDLKNKIENSTTEEFIKEIKDQISINTEREMILKALDDKCSESINRLNNETSALSRRSNLNLVLGIFTTIAGLVVLYVYVSNISFDPKDPLLAAVVSAYFIPRLTLVIFIELFAYFFLKLYKSNLSEIKYFQNELTNIEAKFVSLRTAILGNNDSVAAEVIKSLSATERNFVLEKGQSTVELEHHKMDKESISEARSIVSDLLKKIKITT